MSNNEKTLNKTENKHTQTKDGRPLGVQSILLSYSEEGGHKADDEAPLGFWRVSCLLCSCT